MENQTIRMKILRKIYLKNMLNNQGKKLSVSVRKTFYGIAR